MINRFLQVFSFCAALYLGLAYQIEGKLPMMVAMNQSGSQSSGSGSSQEGSASLKDFEERFKGSNKASVNSSAKESSKESKGVKSQKTKTAEFTKLSKHIAKKYRVNNELADKIVALSYKYGKQQNVDPLVILAVAARESSFRPEVLAKGDHGLMQVNPKYHREKLQGKNPSVLFDVEYNVRTGTMVLAEYKKASKGSYWGALRRYNGLDKSNNYPDEVLAIRQEFIRIAS